MDDAPSAQVQKQHQLQVPELPDLQMMNQRQEKKEISPEHSARAQWSPVEAGNTSEVKEVFFMLEVGRPTSPSLDSSPTSARDDTSLKDVQVKNDLLKKRGIKEFDSSEQCR